MPNTRPLADFRNGRERAERRHAPRAADAALGRLPTMGSSSDDALLPARLLRAASTPLVDLRSAEAFSRAHIHGSVNIPLAVLRRRSHELPPATDAAGVTLVVGPADVDAAREEMHLWRLVDVLDATPELWDQARDLGVLETGSVTHRFLWSPAPHLAAVCASVERWVPAAGAGRRALDLGCGRGRDAIWLASRGWSVVGVDNQAVFLDHLRQFAERERLSGLVAGVCLDLAAPGAHEALRSLLRPPLALVNMSRFMHRGLLDFVAGAMPAGCVLAVHHFEEGSVSLKSGRAIKPHDAQQCSLASGELATRYAQLLPEVLVDESGSSADGGRPMCSYAARKPPLLGVTFCGGGQGGGGTGGAPHAGTEVRVRACLRVP